MLDLDRLLEAARAAEPEPLSDAEAEALVRGAREARPSLEQVIVAARGAEPDPLSDEGLSAMVERAAMTGRARHRRWSLTRVMGAAALAAAAAVATFALSPGAPLPADSAPRPVLARDTEPTDLALATGDRLVAGSGARFDVHLPEPHVRRVRLGGGSMLFDVRPIEGGRFTVSTAQARVHVLGTVFSVRASEDATTVWVYEGVVRVEGPEGARVVRAGGVVHVGEGEAGVDALAAAGREAAARRSTPLALREPRPEAPPRQERAPVRPAPQRASAPRSDRRPAPRPPSTPRPSEPSSPPPLTPADVRARIARGEAAQALVTIESALARGEQDPWRMLQGDALRASGRFDEAAAAYRRAAAELAPPRRQQAGFLEARLRAARLDDADGALRALDGAGVTRQGSVLRERGMALEARLLVRLDRHADADQVARAYLRDYPEGPDADAMRARVGTPAPEP